MVSSGKMEARQLKEKRGENMRKEAREGMKRFGRKQRKLEAFQLTLLKNKER
jgi:hypothetical protein